MSQAIFPPPYTHLAANAASDPALAAAGQVLETVREQLFGPCRLAPGRRIILAVSGGLDSTVLAWTLHSLNMPLILAHGQFGLRGAESAADQAFVEAMAHQWQLPLRVRAFAVGESQAGQSVQMQARNARRAWLLELKGMASAHAVATAHHADDQAETVVMRLMAGSGVEGLAGIRPRHEGFIRPMLPLPKAALRAAAECIGLPWREDRSNAQSTYWRNQIRLELLPQMERMRPGSKRVLARAGERFAQTAVLYRAGLEAATAALRLPLDHPGEAWDLRRLRRHPAAALLLESRLKGLGAERAQAAECWARIQTPHSSASGAQWHFPEGRMVLDRDRLLFLPGQTSTANPCAAPTLPKVLAAPPLRMAMEQGRLRVLAVPGHKVKARMVEHHRSQDNSGARSALPNPSDRVWMDAGALARMMAEQRVDARSQESRTPDARPGDFPAWVIRPWRSGDYFHPLPGGKKRSLKRYLTDRKVTPAAKKDVLVLACGERILWVPGWGLDKRVAPRPGCPAWDLRWEAL